MLGLIGCFLWWILFGGLLGWVAGWWADSRFGEPEIRLVDRPVEKLVEKIVDNPQHLARIRMLERETAMIAGMQQHIAELEAREPEVVERPVEKIVEKFVDRLVDNPAHLARIKQLETEASLVPGLRRRVAELESRPPKIVEKIVEKPVEKIVDRPVDNPAHVARIRSLEADAALVSDLRRQVAELESRPPRIVEKVVEKPVEKVVDRPVDNPALLARIRQLEGEANLVPGLRRRIADLEARPPEIVEKPVERLADNPVHLARIRTLESEVALVPTLRNRIAELEARPPRTVERIIERLAPDAGVNEERDRRLRDLERRFEDLEAMARGGRPSISRGREEQFEATPRGLGLWSSKVDVAAARAAGLDLQGPDDLTAIAGLSRDAANVLREAGASTFAHVASLTPQELAQILRVGGVQADPASWPEQAELAARNHWRALRAMQQSIGSDRSSGGKA